MDKQPITEKLCQEYLNGWKRCLADFDNYKKTETERMAGVILFTKQDLLFQFLAVFDNFERIKGHLPVELEQDEWAKGVLLVENQFQEVLKSLGLAEVEAIGQKFDPNLHEAVEFEQAKTENRESGTIFEVVQKGYILNGQLLRPAKVKVTR